MDERVVTERLEGVDAAKLASWNTYQTAQAARRQALEELRDSKPVATLAGVLARLAALERLVWDLAGGGRDG